MRIGIKQSGDMSFRLADIKRDYNILLKAKEDSYNYLLKKTEEEKILKQKIIDSIIHS